MATAMMFSKPEVYGDDLEIFPVFAGDGGVHFERFGEIMRRKDHYRIYERIPRVWPWPKSKMWNKQFKTFEAAQARLEKYVAEAQYE